MTRNPVSPGYGRPGPSDPAQTLRKKMYRLDQEQQQSLESFRPIAESAIAPHAARVDRDGVFPREAIAALGAAGLLGLTVPKAFGGKEQNARMAAALLDEIAQRCPSTAMVYLMHLCGIACYAAASEQDRRLASKAARGRPSEHAGLQRSRVAEPFLGAGQPRGGDNGAVRIARRSRSSRRPATPTDTSCRRWPRRRERPVDSTLYLVLRDDPGVSVSGAWNGLGLRGNASAAMTLDNVKVSGDRALSAPGKGLDMMLGVVLPLFQVGRRPSRSASPKRRCRSRSVT